MAKNQSRLKNKISLKRRKKFFQVIPSIKQINLKKNYALVQIREFKSNQQKTILTAALGQFVGKWIAWYLMELGF